MIKSFVEYIFEANVNAVRIFYSKRLREFLYSIEKNSKDTDVARLASALRHAENSNQVSLDITFIDLTDRNDMVSFIQANRIKRKFADKNSHPNPDNFDNFDEYLTFIGTVDPGNTLWREQRGEVGIGKYARKVFKESGIGLSDTSLEKFVNVFKSTFDFEYNFDQKMNLVTGEDIRKWYLETNYAERKSQLGNSCMRYDKCQKYLDIYVKNPEVCSLLIMYSDQSKEKISGRSLVWKTTDGNTVMDRIYTINDYDIESFRKYASSKGWLDVTKGYKTYKIQLGKISYDFYPYMDNFYIYNYIDNILTNDSDKWPSEGYYKLQNTDGSFTSDEGVWSEYHGEYLERDYAVWCENANDYVSEDDAIWLEYKGIFASPAEETVYSEWFDQTYYLDDTVHSEVMNDHIPTDESRSIFVNYYGDEDYIVDDFAGSALVSAQLGDEEVETLSKFVILNPITGKYHFRDEKVGEVKIGDYILNELSNIEVDNNKIRHYLIDTDFKISASKLREIQSMYRIYSGFPIADNSLTKGIIKYLLYAYPNKSNQRDGMPILPQERGLTNSDRYLRFKNSMINFDTELFDILTEGDERAKRSSNDTIFSLTCLSQAFIEDVFQDLDIYKMWYKWKNT
jgi:hypothetical protein